ELFARIRRLLKRNPPAVCQPANHFPPPSTLPESPTPALSGATITSGLHDQYIIGDKLGQGTAGVVFKAQHRFLNRSLAIKILQPASIVDPATVTRFKREASLVSTLNHPNIVSVYECGVSALGLPFLVMEYLEGKSLNDILEIEGRLEPNRMLPLFLQACEALQHAHDLGIVHRDLKPSNIMISRLSDGKERLKLVDFGIAKAIESEDDTLTREGAFVGTPLYMSPEQVKGEGLDSRSDIFSLGCVMYETLTGHKPFMGSNMFHTLLKRTIETAKPMSEVCPQHNVPEALENIVFKAMAIMRCDRYQTIACLKDDLSALKI
ncbi:MAG TPA: serine/threonine-protein kinase, partial [Candidatus Obscuribacterales bacterium]